MWTSRHASDSYWENARSDRRRSALTALPAPPSPDAASRSTTPTDRFHGNTPTPRGSGSQRSPTVPDLEASPRDAVKDTATQTLDAVAHGSAPTDGASQAERDAASASLSRPGPDETVTERDYRFGKTRVRPGSHCVRLALRACARQRSLRRRVCPLI